MIGYIDLINSQIELSVLVGSFFRWSDFSTASNTVMSAKNLAIEAGKISEWMPKKPCKRRLSEHSSTIG